MSIFQRNRLGVHHLPGRQARHRPAALAVVTPQASITYAGLDTASSRFGRLLHIHGVLAGARVALILPNGIDWLVCSFGISKAGAVMVPLNPAYTDTELRHVFDDAEVALVICRATHIDRMHALKAQCPHLRSVLQVDGPGALEELLADQSDAALDPGLDSSSAHSILYTSGTTGRAKGAVLSHRARLVNTLANQAAYGIDASTRMACAIPLFHSGGLTLATINTLAAGGVLVLSADASPEAAHAAIAELGANYLIAVPTIIKRWLDDAAFTAAHAQQPLRLVHGGSTMPAMLAERVVSEWSAWQPTCAYGSTEAGQLTVLNGDDYWRCREGATGRALQSTELRVVDAVGEDVAPGEIGEIVTAGAHLFDGYLNAHEATAQATRMCGGIAMFRTGDMARIDASGLISIVGRHSELIISGGLNVYAPEVENALQAHPQVDAAAVLGLADERWGEIVCACVRLRPGSNLDEAELLQFCGQHLAPYKKPKRVVFVQDFPLTAAGKVRKAQLREQLEAASR